MNIDALMLADLKRGSANLKKHYGLDHTKWEDLEAIMNLLCEMKDSGNKVVEGWCTCAVVLRFMFMRERLRLKSPLYSDNWTDYINLIYEGIELACKYRAWQTKGTNVIACIRQSLETARLRWQYDANLDKHKASYNTMSLEDTLSEDNEVTRSTEFLEIVEDETADPANDDGEAGARAIVQMYVDKNKLVEAVILDTIAFNDVDREVKTTVTSVDKDGNEIKTIQKHKEFWEFKAAKLLRALPDSYPQYFSHLYGVKAEDVVRAKDAIKNANSSKLYRYLRATLAKAKKDLS